ncbi:MAG: hypothetical protein FJW88_08965 [Actinobacteria bacterium]|nr:hypothetical protein [Actinomycetota bacterium]
MRRSRTRFPLRFAALLASIVVLAGVLVPGAAHADEIMPGVDVLSVTVTGPGLAEPVRMTDEDAATFMKGLVGGGVFVPEIERPPEDAKIYTARYETMVKDNPGKGKILFAWDGTSGWVSGEGLLEKRQYMIAGTATVEAMADVLAQVQDHPGQDPASNDAASSSQDADDDGFGLAPVELGIGVAVAVILVGWVVWLLMRRRRASPTG